MLLDELRQSRVVLNTLAQRYGASNLRVFGSVARREETAESDVDFLVQLPQGYDMFAQRLPLTRELAELLHRRVEVIPEHELNQYLKERILHEALPL